MSFDSLNVGASEIVNDWQWILSGPAAKRLESKGGMVKTLGDALMAELRA